MNAQAAPPQTIEPPAVTTFNTAESDATIGIQAGVVHHASVYQISANDPPEKKYATGLRYLDNGVPLKAEELFSAAIADGLDTAEVRFHWVLAMFSSRSDRDLTKEERTRLVDAARRFVDHEDDASYGPALGALRELVVHRFRPPVEGIDLAEKQILALPAEIRDKTLRHLDKVLSTATKDQLWAGTRKKAEADRYSAGRQGRVWAYFHPEPAHPRVRRAEPQKVARRDRYRVATGTILCVLAAAYLGWLTFTSAVPVAMVAYVLALTAAGVSARDAFEWRYRADRIKQEEARRSGGSAAARSEGQGFAARVTRSFEHYFTKYRPQGAHPDRWLSETAGLRAQLRDEIVEIYRERDVSFGSVVWLIRYHAIDVQKQWSTGALDDYKSRHQVTDKIKLRCVLGLTILVLTLAAVVQGAMLGQPPGIVVVATALFVANGLFAAKEWYRIISGRRNHLDDVAEIQRRKEGRENEYLRWKHKLDTTRPSEDEMETWLRSDTTILIAEALEHYRISWRDVISYAVLRVPAPNASSAQVPRGPLRYDRYSLRLFLITEDGVREVSKVLNFRTAQFNAEERNSFRFEAVSSVNVVKGTDGKQNLRLTLTNGPARYFGGATGPDLGSGEDELRYSRQAELDPNDTDSSGRLDTTGFEAILRILEGIAADGKNWFARSNY
jgi:hypothetical protein